MKLLEGKTAVITGASRGIGRGIALEFAENGANVVIFDLFDNEDAQKTISDIRSLGVKCELYLCDISKEDTVQAAVQNAIRDFGRVDILVNNAGVTRDKLMLSMTEADFDFVVNINLKGTFLVTKSLIRHFMKNRCGRIVNISSVVALTGNPGQANYVSSKAGVIGLTKTVAKEYASKGITCNAIAPGYIATAMTDVLPDSVKESMLKTVPAGRPGTDRDIAHTALFLASDLSAYVTGEVIRVDGGMCM